MFDTTTITYLQKFKKLALAVSGGIDSMCLLSAYEQHKNILPEFVVVNVHHNLRGDEGRSDSEFVRAYCQSKGITCLFFDEDIPSFCNKGGYGVEQGARIRRREIFKQLT
ncbi:MAG: ATP-binding protein, partial [Clostridia bacterium]